MPGLRLAPLDLDAVVGAVVDRLRPVAAERGQTLRGPARRARVLGDRRQLARVVTNLVGNAIKYTPDGGDITVDVDDGPAGGVLTVRDTGYGIGPADLPRVFTKHARFHRDRRIPGSGLGLYLSRAIVEAHGGTIAVASVLGQGSTFTVRLPAPPP
jgi:two-component system sensor histidine kinase BaeS